MRKLLNTMFITTQGGYLSRDGESVVLKADSIEKIRFPIINLEGLVCFGNVAVSSSLLQLCSEQRVGVSFLSEQGRFMARSVGRYQGNVLLRRAHHRIADSPKRSASIAHAIVVAKVLNSRTLLLRARREHPSDGNFDDAITQLDTIVRSNTEVASVDHLRAIEGDAARRYFQVFDHLILINKRDFYFKLRSRRPPLDRVNAMLSFVYTLLAHDMVSALECVGLDPAVGFLHADRPGRPSLALDVMEEFRPFLADRLVLSLINRQQVTGKGFSVTESGAVEMDEETRKTLISAFQNRKREEIEHPFLKEKIAIGLIPYTQALLLARHIRGDLDAYPPFIWK